MGCAAVANGVEETVGVAVCVGVEVGVELGVEVGVPAGAVGVASPEIAVAAGLGVLVAVCSGAGSCAIASPPSTATYSAAQLMARARIFLGDRVTGGFFTRARGKSQGSDSAQLRHRTPCA